MESLSVEEIKKRIESGLNQQELKRSRQKKFRQNVHSETITLVSEYNQGHQDILRWIKNDVLSDEESFNSLNGIIRPPFPTNELNESIFADVSRIFKAEDFFQKFMWSGKSSHNEEAKQILKKAGEDAFWDIQAQDTYRTDPDCLIVVDRPPAESEDKTPYFYKLPLEKVKAIELKKDRSGMDISVEWVAFSCGEKEIAYFDHNQIVIFDEEKNEVKTQVVHEIGWTPVKPFWQSTLNSSTLIQKRNRATKSISDFDWLFFYEYAKRWQDLCNPFPIWAMYEHSCKYQDKETGSTCERGYLYYEVGGEPASRKCPACAKKFKRGPNRLVKVPTPQSKEDPDLMSHPPVQTITPEVDSMEFVTKEVERLNAKIYKNCAGMDLEMMKKQAINKDQVASFFESRKSILLWEKRNFDIIRNWIVETILKMEFGDTFIKAHTDHGEEFYLESELDKVEEYKTAKDSSLPLYDLKTRREAMIHSKFRNNPEKIDRAMIMAAVEPFPDMTITEMQALEKELPGTISEEDIIVKIKFSNFIDRFERENGPLSHFGENLKGEMEDGTRAEYIRLNKIRNIIYEYGKTEKNTGTRRKPEPSGATGQPGPGAGENT